MTKANALSIIPVSLVSALCLLAASSCATSSPTPPPATAGAEPSPAAPAPAAPASADIGAKLRTILALPHRTEAEKKRDQYRHPVETLSFFGLRDDMTVVELWPGGGWYTAVLAPLLREKGKLIVTSTKGANGQKYVDNLKAHPDLYDKVEVRMVAPPADLNLGPDGSADMVVTFRNIHGWVPGGYDDKVYAAAYRVLKPGGVFGVEEHRARAGSDPAELKDTGYVPEDFVIKRVEAAGFKLAGKSEVNANPKDTKDHPKGVWTLPPTLRLGEVDKDKYLAIGESDRMTLKFVKP
jgi:predicted methyltransferase